MDRGAWFPTVHWGPKELDMTEHTHTHISLHDALPILIYLAVLGLSCSIWNLVPQAGIQPRPPALGA